MDKERLVANMTALIARKDKRIGEVESAIGVSQSYLSKFSKPDSKQIPSIETVANLAQYLGVTIDELLYSDLTGYSETDKKIRDFILALGKDTEKDVVRWDSEDFNTELYRSRKNQVLTHEIFDLERGRPTTPLDFADGKEFLKHPINPELFGSTDFYMDGDCYKCNLTDKQCIYVFKGRYGVDPVSAEDFSPFYGLVIEDTSDGEHYTEVLKWEELIWPDPTKPKTPGTVGWLYDTVGNSWFDIRISKKSRDFIDSYLEKRKG